MPDLSREALIRLYWHEKFTQYEIAAFFDTHQTRISQTMEAKGIPSVKGGVPEEPHTDEELLRTLYWEKLLCVEEMATLLDKTSSGVNYWLRKLDIDRRNIPMAHAARRVREHEGRPREDEDLMRELYEDRLLSVEQIADLLNTGSSSVMYWFDNHGIETRSRSEGIYLRLNGELPPEDGSVSMDDQYDGPPVLMADGGQQQHRPPEQDDDEMDTYDPASEIQQAVDKGPDTNKQQSHGTKASSSDDDDDSSDGDRTPGTLTDRDKLSVRLTLTAWGNHRKTDLSATELRVHAIRPLSQHFERRALDILYAHDVIEEARTVGVSRMYELTGEDVPFDETLTELVTKLDISIPSEELKSAEADPTNLA